MKHVIEQVEAELKRELEAHERTIIEVAYQFGQADAISKAQSILPILKRRAAEALLAP